MSTSRCAGFQGAYSAEGDQQDRGKAITEIGAL